MTAYLDRFGGIARLYGTEALARFQSARVAVVGVGGVGSWAVEALARSGVGSLTFWDLDDVCVSNTNRQSHTTTDTLGQFKVDVLAERCRAINPDIEVAPRQQFLTPGNLDDSTLADHDFVIDAIDSVPVKVALVLALREAGVPYVLTGGAGGQTDPTQIRRADLSAAVQDPLAARVRQMLRREHGFPGGGRRMKVPCIYSQEPLVYPQPDGTVCATRHPDAGNNLNCAGGFGASMAVTATFGMVAVAAALEALSA
ncbi:MAG: tRNA threonylcarbamoyladenosine dehydratase [Natronospirillum sp.]|uniref:tRNA threonylcarbamoyladenosine dehydratase n=1 Tax=Natronospirillum sp. TaxID=2812955 RepID=UPI0025FEE93E|nr:tRNA threonylcarbamoyladenosine dehydratase [Natronospirillum sp.]MCH8550626.1 tRNA threonylcarbamoyladenosine dehydratase [Natronospirillum sp.]